MFLNSSKSAHFLPRGQTGITDCQREQFDQKVLDLAHAVSDVEQTLLEHPQRGHVRVQIEPQHLPEASQELHQHQAVGHGASWQDESGDAGELWERLEHRQRVKSDSFFFFCL